MAKYYVPSKDDCKHLDPARTEAVIKAYRKPGGDMVVYCTKCFTEADIDNMDVVASGLTAIDKDDAKLKDGKDSIDDVVGKLQEAYDKAKIKEIKP